MSGTNRRSSLQTAEDILSGHIRHLDGRTLKFFAQALLKAHEQTQEQKRKANALEQKLKQIDFKQHKFSTLQRHYNDILGRYRRNQIRRKAIGLPDDAIPLPFAVFMWYVNPRGGWKDMVKLCRSKEEAEAYRRKTKTNWTHSDVVDLRVEDVLSSLVEPVKKNMTTQ